MPKKQPGYAQKLYIGAAGSPAGTQVLNATNIEYDNPIDYADTTTRGDGDTIPHKDREPVAIDAKLTWSMIAKDGDTELTTLLAAALNDIPTPLAIKYTNSASGKSFDGDCYIKVKDGAPLNGADTFDFEALPTTAAERDWTNYAA